MSGPSRDKRRIERTFKGPEYHTAKTFAHHEKCWLFQCFRKSWNFLNQTSQHIFLCRAAADLSSTAHWGPQYLLKLKNTKLMFSFSFTYTEVDTLFKLIIEHCLMSKFKADMWPALATLKSLVFEKRGAASGIQGPWAVMPWLLVRLLISCEQRAIFPLHAPHKPHLKVD